MSRGRGNAPSLRQLRVGEELRHALVRVLERSDFSDPKLADAKITVTEVSVSPDLKNATVFVTPLGGERLSETVAALNKATGFLRGQLGREISLRYTPRLSFAADHSFVHASRVEELLARPRVKQDLEADAERADEDD
ncbi:MAG: 30S ribosome-binding factor RbfA [Pseudomonadota bacterium]